MKHIRYLAVCGVLCIFAILYVVSNIVKPQISDGQILTDRSPEQIQVNNDTPSPTPVADIDKTPANQVAIRDRLISMLDPSDSNTIFKVVDAIQADPDLRSNCHEIAHDIGHKALEYYGFSDAMTFDNPNHIKHALVQNICAGGYMHGILEELSLYQPDFLAHPEIVCDRVPLADRASCFHGMGHVYMLANDRNAPAAILGCRVIERSADMYRCFEGVRMEQFWDSTFVNGLSSTTLGWDPQNPLATCTGLEADERPTCFLYATFGYLRLHPRDYIGAAGLCSKSGLNNLDDDFCFKGLGMTMMSKFKGQNMEQSEVYVAGQSLEEKQAFYQGVMGYAHLSGLSSDELQNVCNLLKNDALICSDALAMSAGS